jgi:hypothetical protein
MVWMVTMRGSGSANAEMRLRQLEEENGFIDSFDGKFPTESLSAR